VNGLLHLFLSRLMVALAVLGLAGLPLHTAASTPEPISVQGLDGATAAAAGQHADHGHGAPLKCHASGQSCCHPACSAALIQVPAASAVPAVPASPLRMSRDPVPSPVSPPGIDHPPKHA
jgi:hypothetical protein